MRLHDLQAFMRSGATLLTPTQRAARLWRNRLVQAEPGLRPAVLPWGAWTVALWQNAVLRGDADRALLNPTQNAELWAQVLRASKPGTLRPLRSLVELCVQAEHLLYGYGAGDAMLQFAGVSGSDAAQFADWFRTSTERCDVQRLLPAASLEAALQRLPGTHATTPLALVGFDDLLPSRQSLLDHLVGQGVTITNVDASSLMDIQTHRMTRCVCSDGADEWRHLGHALRRIVTDDRGGSVVVVVPDLDASRESLERELRQALGTFGSTQESDWEFSAGRALGTLPLAADAIGLLRWAMDSAPVESVSALLQSPYLDFGVSHDGAAEIDIRVLRRPEQVRPEWTTQALAKQCVRPMRDVLELIASISHLLRGVRAMSAWTEAAGKVLQAAGWPGRRELSSEEYQTLDRWNDLLDGMASLDMFERPVPFAEFVSMLAEGAAKLRFAPENKGAAIQILSPDEAAGITADRLWFAHANDTCWSGKRSASPLLPWALQVSFGMPGTDAMRDGEAHRRMTERLLRSATETTVSYAETDRTGKVKPAAVLHGFPMLDDPDTTVLPAPQDRPLLEIRRDDTGPAFLSDAPVAGGVAVLQSQAACAFKAFAEMRLYSSEPEPQEPGFTARDRGTHMHRVLQLFWNRVKTQTELIKLRNAGQLEASVQSDIEAVLPTHGEHNWERAYLQVQRERLKQVVLQWLEVEAQRPAFEVKETERTTEAAMGPLRFGIRVDRIDTAVQDEQPSLVLIDYKTGKPSTNDWTGPRPKEPQLPFYAVAAGMGDVRAIAFASTKPGEKNMGMQSFPAATPLLFHDKASKKPQDFAEQSEEWKDTLLHLAEAFARGDARVDPREYPSTCRHCRQRMLCRLDPESLVDDDDDPAEGLT